VQFLLEACAKDFKDAEAIGTGFSDERRIDQAQQAGSVRALVILAFLGRLGLVP